MSKQLRKVAENYLVLSDKVNEDAEKGRDVDLEDYFSLQQMGETLAQFVVTINLGNLDRLSGDCSVRVEA